MLEVFGALSMQRKKKPSSDGSERQRDLSEATQLAEAEV